MGLSSSYWQLVVLRMMISAGESVCRPMSSALIADMFTPSARGVANGVFSWGVYLGYGLAFVLGNIVNTRLIWEFTSYDVCHLLWTLPWRCSFHHWAYLTDSSRPISNLVLTNVWPGINLTQADLLGYSWRSTYVVAALPGLLLSALILCTLRDPSSGQASSQTSTPLRNSSMDVKMYMSKLWQSFTSPALLLLLIAAMARQTAGFSWAYNTRLYFQNTHPHFNLGYWILLASCVGGSFGVFAGGFLSDRLVTRLGLHSRLWLLSGNKLSQFSILAID